MPERLNILFVCGRNNRRSPTAEKIFKSDRRMNVRGVGTAETSKRRVTEADLKWADLVLVMERKHASRLREMFHRLDELPPMQALEIPDEYIFMQAELIALLREAVDAALETFRLDQAATPDED